MRGLRVIGVTSVILILAFMAYVRFSGLSETRWHVAIAAGSDVDYPGGAVRVLAGDAALFGQVHKAVSALPRTQLLAGSFEEGRITYVTRSAFLGFPDLTTLELRDHEVALYGRLRFGKSDLGVNRKRLEGVIAQVQGG